MNDVFLLATYMILPPTASLLITRAIKERQGISGLLYPWATRILRWCLWASIIAGALMLTQWAAIALGDPAGHYSISLVSALDLMLVVLLVPSYVGAYFAWYLTPIVFWSQATSGRRALAKSRRNQARYSRKTTA